MSDLFVFGSYPVTVNYDLTVEQLVKAGKYVWSDGDVTSKNFPSTETGQAEVMIYLVTPRYDISSEDIIQEMDKMDPSLRPATLKELLALGAQYPDLQKQTWIVALGSPWSDLGMIFVPCLDDDPARNLSLDWYIMDWDSDWSFACVRK